MKTKEIKETIKNIDSIPGRMEEIRNTPPYKIFLDSANNHHTLEQALENIKSISGINRIITVF
jgi:UDP-N-acetylmuramyl tripeptide synthase